MSSWYYDYTKFKVKPENIPSHPHYAVLVFRIESYSTPAYDRFDTGGTTSVTVCDYYAFVDKTEWEKMISAIYTERHSSNFGSDRSEIVFYYCSGRGKVNVSIDVSVKE